MANTLTLLDATPYRVSYLVSEAATAAGSAVETNMSSSLTASTPLYTLVTATYASQAAARTAIYGACDILCVPRALSVGTAQLLVDFTVNGTALRLTTLASKAANGDTGDWVLTVSYRMSVID